MNETIFTQQVNHHRVVALRDTTTCLGWLREYSWFPKEQRCVYMESDRIYKEVIDKYGRDMFQPYATERHVARRIFTPDAELEKNKIRFVDFSYIEQLRRQETTSQSYGRYKPYVFICSDEVAKGRTSTRF